MKDSEVLEIANKTLDQGLYFGKGKIIRSTEDEILRFSFQLEMAIRKRLSDWVRNNYQGSLNISDICDHILDQSK